MQKITTITSYPKQFISATVRRKIRLAIRRYTYHKYLQPPTLENINANTFAFSYKYSLSMSHYFNSITSWKLDRSIIAESTNMSLQHYAMVDYLKNFVKLPPEAQFLDVCCGMGHLFVFLQKMLGYQNLIGVDDSTFQPGIISAAAEFSTYYGLSSTYLDFNNVAFPPQYDIPKLRERIDVFSHFTVDTFYFYPIAYRMLKPGGLYIAEMEDPDPGIYRDCFEVQKVYEGYGRLQETGRHPYHIVVMRKIG